MTLSPPVSLTFNDNVRLKNGYNNMSWSENSISNTKKSLVNLDYSSINGKIHFKNYDGCFGYLEENQFLKGVIILNVDNKKITYQDINYLINDGWVLD